MHVALAEQAARRVPAGTTPLTVQEATGEVVLWIAQCQRRLPGAVPLANVAIARLSHAQTDRCYSPIAGATSRQALQQHQASDLASRSSSPERATLSAQIPTDAVRY